MIWNAGSYELFLYFALHIINNTDDATTLMREEVPSEGLIFFIKIC